jgi:hypothetical protein
MTKSFNDVINPNGVFNTPLKFQKLLRNGLVGSRNIDPANNMLQKSN